MVALQHELVEKGLGMDHLRLVMGTSMGCMHSWMWGEAYPDMMDALMPLACKPVQSLPKPHVAQDDHRWNSPGPGLAQRRLHHRASRRIADLHLYSADRRKRSAAHAGGLSTREAADEDLDEFTKRVVPDLDANDFLYAVSSSRDYGPSSKLETIKAPVMFINSGDDFINPPELGIAEREIKKVKNGKFVLLPTSEQTHGHGTHTDAAVWQQYLKELLDHSQN